MGSFFNACLFKLVHINAILVFFNECVTVAGDGMVEGMCFYEEVFVVDGSVCYFVDANVDADVKVFSICDVCNAFLCSFWSVDVECFGVL